MAPVPETDDPPSEHATVPSLDPPPDESQDHAMEVDDQEGHAPSVSHVSPAEDTLLTGESTVDVERGMASLTVSSLLHPEGSDADAST